VALRRGLSWSNFLAPMSKNDPGFIADRGVASHAYLYAGFYVAKTKL